MIKEAAEKATPLPRFHSLSLAEEIILLAIILEHGKMLGEIRGKVKEKKAQGPQEIREIV